MSCDDFYGDAEPPKDISTDEEDIPKWAKILLGSLVYIVMGIFLLAFIEWLINLKK